VIRKDLVRTMSEQTHMTLKDCSLALEAFIETVKETLEAGGDVKLSSFGVFSTRDIAARNGFNIGTQKMQTVAARTVPHFKFSKVVKDEFKKLPCDDDQATD
jgi:DNA-binding protein HU-beta